MLGARSASDELVRASAPFVELVPCVVDARWMLDRMVKALAEQAEAER